MPWSLFPWSDNIKKRCVRYLIQRYLGQFIEEKLTLDQLTVDLYNGTGSVSNVTLDVQALNEIGEQQNLPIEFVDGFIKEFSVSIPWSSLLRDSSSVEVNGLYLVIQPKQRLDTGSFMFESMWSSMTSSIQLAEECLKSSSEQALNEIVNPVNGVEEFAKTIDTVLNRVKIKFVDAIIRLEYLHRDSQTGGAIEMHINQFYYCDETSDEVHEDNSTKPATAYSVKLITFEGVEFFTSEFNASNRSISRSLLVESSTILDEEIRDIFEKRRVTSEDNILFAKFLSKQEVRLRFKQKENAGGPKIDLGFTLSTLILLLSPRQLRTVCEVIYALMSPHLQDTSNVNRARCHQKPMTTSDFERVEMELNQQINPSNTNNIVSKSLQNTTGWSSAGVDEESDDDFQPVKGQTSSMTCSSANSVSSSMSNTGSYQSNSKLSGQMSSSHSKTHFSRHKAGSSESDFSGEVTAFELRLNFVSLVLLHQDILLASSDSHLPSRASLDNMKTISREFFSYFLTVNVNNVNQYQQKVEQNPINSALKRNHFRLLCCTLILKGEEKSNQSNPEINGTLSLANTELIECLVQMENGKSEFVELIQFGNAVFGESYSSSQPDIVINFKYINNMKRFAATNQTELNVALRHCRTEVDVTIIDRLCHILNHIRSLWATLDKSPNSMEPTLSEVHAPVVDSKFAWKMTSPFITVKLRFPIPDLRNESREHSYWSKREVYSDLLFVELSEMTLSSETTSCEVAHFFELLCKSSRILFQEASADRPLPFIFCGCDDKAGMSLADGGTGFGWPRLVIRVYPRVKYFELEDEDERLDLGENMAQSIIQTQKQEPSPFAAKMIKRESDTSHSKSSANYDGEEIILPGSKEEMGDFMEHATGNAMLQFELMLPLIVVHLPSKHFCEIIYNRFNTDLMLWTPKSTKTSSNDGYGRRGNFNGGESMFTSFSMCKSAVRTDSDDEDADDNSLLGRARKKLDEKKAACKQQSKLTISIVATQGVVDVFPHARDSTGKVIPCQFGELQLLFQEANLFCVSGYKGDALLNFVCLHINQVSLYHCSLIPAAADVLLKPFEAYPSTYMLPTIYKSPAGAVVNENASPVGTGSSTSDDMLTLAIKVQGQENRFKSICVANSLNGATVRHRIRATHSSWLSQIIDFFDIVDYPVSNYQPWQVVTQMHQQLLNCVIDYRPLYLPYKAALTVENFNISSNITSKTPTSIVRFIAEEASFFVSNKVTDDRDDDLSVDLKNDFVCVIDLGLFELSLRLTDNGDKEPLTDLRASNNILHIYTCADSAFAAMELVRYIASDGDLNDGNMVSSISTKSHDSNDDLLVNLQGEQFEDPDVPCMGTNDAVGPDQGVPHLVEEAMNDTIDVKPKKQRAHRDRCERTEVFYFPNENDISLDFSKSFAISESEASDEEYVSEYCMVDQEVGMGCMGQNDSPLVRLLTDEPIRIVDNHFTVPVEKFDVLKAPKDYPTAIIKYTLREMTLVWHLFGGNDFSKDETKQEKTEVKKQVIIVSDKKSSSESLHSFDNVRSPKKPSMHGINITYSNNQKSPETASINFPTNPLRSSPRLSYSDYSSDSPTFSYEKQKSVSWKVRGGVNRQHDVSMELKLSKLKYQYEIYPKDTKQASRQVFAVQDVEVSDRMASSQINKFLYLYSSAAKPKQSNAHMVIIKSTYIRPELNVSNRLECCLRVSFLPLRLNIDQDSFLFLATFFNEISGNKSDQSNSKNSSPTKPQSEPVLNIEHMNTSSSSSIMSDIEDKRLSPSISAPSNAPVFIRSFIFAPEVPIRLDYEGKRVDMSHGPLAGLIMGLGKLTSSDLKLKQLCNRHGILGFEKLISYVITEWLNDIKKNQLPSLLGGVGPMNSVVQLVQGIRDLFWLPIEQYQKDGRIVRGLQRGANSFTTSTAMAALELTARLVYAIQRIAETAFDLVSPGPSIRHLKYYDRSGKNDPRKARRHHHKYNQPADIREGVASALQLVKEGIEETAQTFIRVAAVENEVKGAVGAVGGIIREMPSAALTPIILATQATSNVLDGVRSHLVPDAKTEAALKWKSDYFS